MSVAEPLANRSLVDRFAVSAPSMSSVNRSLVTSQQAESWTRVADSGTVLANGATRTGLVAAAGAQRVGTSVARFVVRGGKAVASSF
jgi:hypothetical protein